MARIKEWLGGPIVHNHLRLGDDPWLSRFERQQFTPEGAIAYARQFTGNQRVQITDTNHALLFFEDGYLNDREISDCSGDGRRIAALINHISGQVDRRAEEMKAKHGENILTGVEVDLLDVSGRLDIEDYVLGHLDTVIASLHLYTWRDFNGSLPNLKEVINGFLNASQNPHVDILGHPTYLPDVIKDSASVHLDWYELFLKMRQRQVAFEVNIGSGVKWSDPDMQYDRLVVREAVVADVPLVISLDFHNFAYFNLPVDEYLVVSQQNSDSFFENNRGQINFDFLNFLRVNLGILRQLGVKPENVINSSDERFRRWQKVRSR